MIFVFNSLVLAIIRNGNKHLTCAEVLLAYARPHTSIIYAGRKVCSISDTLLLAVIHITDVHVLLFMIQQFLSSYFSVLFSFCIMLFISALRIVVLNSVPALIDLCTIFTFSSASSGGLYRFFFLFSFFAMCTSKLQAYFILSLSSFKCFPSVFCSSSCGISHICDVIALVLWTLDKLRMFMILPYMFSLWICMNMYLYKHLRCIIFLGKLQFKYSWRSSAMFYWHFYNKLLLLFRWINTWTCLPKGRTKVFKYWDRYFVLSWSFWRVLWPTNLSLYSFKNFSQ